MGPMTCPAMTYSTPYEGRLKSIWKSVSPKTFRPLLHTWSYLARLVIIVSGRVHNWIRLLKTFLPSRLHIIFWNCEGWPARRNHPDQYQIPVSMSCDQSKGYFQQPGITVKFWWATKRNVSSLYWVWGVLQDTPNQFTQWEVSHTWYKYLRFFMYVLNYKPGNHCFHTQTKETRITGDGDQRKVKRYLP